MDQFDVEALTVGAFVVMLVIAVAVRLRWQQEHPGRKKKLGRTTTG